MNYVPFVPVDPPLAGTVELVFFVEGYLPGHSRERMVPHGRMHLVIELDGRPRHIYDNDTQQPVQVCRDAWLSGVHPTISPLANTDSESRLLAVQFAPDGSLPFTHRPAEEFCDAVVSAESVFGPSVITVREELRGVEEPRAAIDHLTGWLVERYDPSKEPPGEFRRIVARLLEDPGSARLTELSEHESSVSYRRFIEQFRRFVGPTPKTMQRILRFAEVFERIQGDDQVDWARISHDLGFSDQAHFVREFKSFSGYRPVQFQKQEHDRLNFFPESLELGE